MEQTTLQKIIEQKTDQIRIAIEEAIDAGGEIQKSFTNCATIDDIFLQRQNPLSANSFAIVLRFYSDKIAKLFEPSKDDLEKLAEQKRRELEEIENQIKERAKE